MRCPICKARNELGCLRDAHLALKLGMTQFRFWMTSVLRIGSWASGSLVFCSCGDI